METILIAVQKGGASKTTLARNLSVTASQDGLRVLCLDLDPQGSLRAWWEGRDADTPAMLDRDPAPYTLKATLDVTMRNSAFALSQTPRARITEEAACVLAQHGRVAPANIAQRIFYAATGQGVSKTPTTKRGQRLPPFGIT